MSTSADGRCTDEGHRDCLIRVVHHLQENGMGKYFIGWLLGVPAIVLVLLYLVFH